MIRTDHHTEAMESGNSMFLFSVEIHQLAVFFQVCQFRFGMKEVPEIVKKNFSGCCNEQVGVLFCQRVPLPEFYRPGPCPALIAAPGKQYCA